MSNIVPKGKPETLTLNEEEARVIRIALYSSKFALEQDVSGKEKDQAVEKLNAALDILRKR